MNINEILNQLYYTGLLAFAIMALAIAIVIHGQLQNSPKRSSKKSFDHRVK